MFMEGRTRWKVLRLKRKNEGMIDGKTADETGEVTGDW